MFCNIEIKEKEVIISGDEEGFEALGHALLLKSKLQYNFCCVITSERSLPIKLLFEDEKDEKDPYISYR